MKRINLIPKKDSSLAHPLALRSPVTRIIAILILSVFIGGFFSVTSVQRYQHQIKKRDRERSNLQAELREKERERELIRGEREALLAKKKSIEEKISFLESVKEERQTYSEILVRLTNLVPAEVWIRSLGVAENSITIAGAAADNQNISQFMTNLEESRYFEETNFSYTRKKKLAGRKIFEYELTTRLIAVKE